MDLREYMTDKGLEARYASAAELRLTAESVEDEVLRQRFVTAAALRDLLEARDRDIVDGLLGRFEADALDEVTIILEMTTQEAVVEELRAGKLCQQLPE